MKDGLIEGCIVDGDCIACVFEDPEYTQSDCDYAKKITYKEECIYWKPDADEDFALARIRAEARADALREAAGMISNSCGVLGADKAQEVADAILSLIDQPQEDVCCKWDFREYGGGVKWFGTGCGCLERQTTGTFCQCCGKRIKLKS